ncbi:MAG: hypothetical protein IT422_05270 [Pirellulaceae bacterium]|nr:hypothetical protein [Pirellulaceae bacterium]
MNAQSESFDPKTWCEDAKLVTTPVPVAGLIVGPSDDCKPEIRLFWRSVSENMELVTNADILCENNFDAFHCTRWRTSSYPDAGVEQYEDVRFGESNYVESMANQMIHASR